MTVLEAIANRHAVRAFKPEPVSDEMIHTLLAAAVRAPTAMHAEPWAFVVVQDRELLKKYSDLAKATIPHGDDDAHALAAPRGTIAGHAPSLMSKPEFNIFYDAATLIVICAKSRGAFVAADCWLAAENLMLAALAIDLGSCPIGFAVPVLNRAEVKAELGIPPDMVSVAPIVLGVPSQAAAPTTRREPEILTWRRPAPTATDLSAPPSYGRAAGSDMPADPLVTPSVSFPVETK
jgi:nitroreductase